MNIAVLLNAAPIGDISLRAESRPKQPVTRYVYFRHFFRIITWQSTQINFFFRPIPPPNIDIFVPTAVHNTILISLFLHYPSIPILRPKENYTDGVHKIIVVVIIYNIPGYGLVRNGSECEDGVVENGGGSVGR